MRRLIVIMPVLAAGLALSSGAVLAQSGWGSGGPVFDSDLKREAAKEEAARAERRKTYEPVAYPKFMQGGERPDIKPLAPPIVYMERSEEVGSIIIDTAAHKLYYILPGKKAYQYPISVGREGFAWSGTERISRIAAWPSWTPPQEMHKRVPGLPVTVTGGMLNPQGARALYLGETEYRIHGTNNERTVGRANSSGCFRLSNEHVVHLASIAKVGAKVVVMTSYTGGVSANAPLSSLFGFTASDEPAAAPASPKRKATPVAKKTDGAPPPKPAAQ